MPHIRIPITTYQQSVYSTAQIVAVFAAHGVVTDETQLNWMERRREVNQELDGRRRQTERWKSHVPESRAINTHLMHPFLSLCPFN